MLCKERTPIIMNIVRDPDFVRNKGRLGFYVSNHCDLAAISFLGANAEEIRNYFLSLFITQKLNPDAILSSDDNTEIIYDTTENTYYITVYYMTECPERYQCNYKYKQRISKETAYNVIYAIEYFQTKHYLFNVPPVIINDQARHYGLKRSWPISQDTIFL